MGFSLLRDVSGPEEERKKREEAALLARQLISSGLMKPNVSPGGLISQGPDGLMAADRPAGPSLTGDLLPLDKARPLNFSPSTPAKDPNQLVQVDASMATATGLPEGSYAPMWQIEKIYAPGARAKTISEGQSGRQTAGFKRENVKDALTSADRAVAEFRKTPAGMVADEATTKAMRDKAFDDALSSFESATQSKGQNGKKVTTPPPAAESAMRKQNPTTKKWWVFKGGKWQEE